MHRAASARTLYVERLQPIVDASINYILVYIPGVAYDVEPVQRFASDVLPHFNAV